MQINPLVLRLWTVNNKYRDFPNYVLKLIKINKLYYTSNYTYRVFPYKGPLRHLFCEESGRFNLPADPKLHIKLSVVKYQWRNALGNNIMVLV